MRLTSPRSWLTPSSDAQLHECNQAWLFANVRVDLRAHGGDWGGIWHLAADRLPLRSLALWRQARFVIDHHGGIVISGFARFGDNSRIRSCVTVGLSRVHDPCAPVIGNNVDIGTGAKLLGRITLGDYVFIGANAVVVRDVPSNRIAVGVPAIVKLRSVGTKSGSLAQLARIPRERNLSSARAGVVSGTALGIGHGIAQAALRSNTSRRR